jgi:hypothetical protein
MTIYNSNLVTRRNRHRGMYEGQDYNVAGRVFLANGTVLTTSDDLLFVPVGENQVIHKISLLVLGDTSTIAGSIGTFQILGPDGVTPVTVERLGPLGPTDSKFTSPATSAASLRAAGQLDGYTETVLATPAKLAGPTNVGIRITTGGTIAADTEMFLTVYFKGETSELELLAEYPNPYQYDL